MENTMYLLFLVFSIVHVQFQRSSGDGCGSGDGALERTLAMVKPDGILGNHTEEIKRLILAKGFVIAAQKVVQLDEAGARTFYAEHSQRAFFPTLVKFMTSGPVVAMVLEKEDAVAQWRALIGPTDARKAKISHPQSIRALCGLDTEKNCVHGSDSQQSADREIGFFFGDCNSGEITFGHDEL